ncbi:dipeptidase [Aestuariivirga sp.]|uniref:dipeptidase n=1 Tax=Aestuariivirga sp. TaxID=2650926 RepID=UPI0025C31D2F|nr:dipeptidase [Aestuariivirga sp.]
MLVAVFDGHNDVLLRLWSKKQGDPVADFLNGDNQGHLDLPRMIRGGFQGGFFAIFAPSPDDASLVDDEDMNPPPANHVGQAGALNATIGMASILHRIEERSGGRFKLCRTAAEIRDAVAQGKIAAIFHIEGAEAIDPDLKSLDVLHMAGLRSLGLVWSRNNAFGEGVPFRFPSSPDTGSGLTGAGKALVRRCNELKIMLDVSHLNEKGFWDVARHSTAPIVATHSNAHALCQSSRNLTDDQLKIIGQTGGMVGLNFANGFLRADGRWQSENGLDTMLRHLDHMMKLAGEDHVGLGSDFDGARIPSQIGDVTGLPRLVEAMAAHGYGADLSRKLCSGNWMRVLERSWGE